jgi:dipeptidyl-peptidase-3
MGDYDAAKKMFDHYSEVDEELIKIRQIVIDNKIPRRLELQPNLFLDPLENDVKYKDYEESFEGIIKSVVERYSDAF